jgi:dethiobiotin synthetase
MGTVTCISGIDTNIGKTIVSGLLAKSLFESGRSVITQKIVQTGCSGIAEDIVKHREIMGIDLLPEDHSGLTCPYVFAKACSPHLAADLENTSIDTQYITAATEQLAAEYDHVILEGAGGLLVPLNHDKTFLDYLEQRKYPMILVTSPRLGSINHTLAALELAGNRGIHVRGIVYNCWDAEDKTIRKDSRKVFLSALSKYGFLPVVVEIENLTEIVSGEESMPWQQLITIREKK